MKSYDRTYELIASGQAVKEYVGDLIGRGFVGIRSAEYVGEWCMECERGGLRIGESGGHGVGGHGIGASRGGRDGNGGGWCEGLRGCEGAGT
jgi:hypothetical protein